MAEDVMDRAIEAYVANAMGALPDQVALRAALLAALNPAWQNWSELDAVMARIIVRATNRAHPISVAEARSNVIEALRAMAQGEQPVRSDMREKD